MGSSLLQLGSWRFLPLVAFVLLCGLVGIIGLTTVRTLTSDLLYSEAHADGQIRANYLAGNISDLPSIAQGSEASANTRDILRQIHEIGRIYSFRVYDAKGEIKLESDAITGVAPPRQDSEEINAELATALQSQQPVTFLHTGITSSDPEHYASTVQPIIGGDGKIAGWLATTVDQSERRQLFLATATKGALAVVVLLLIAPILGFFYQNQQKTLVRRQLESLSLHDQLTGLQNKASFLSRMAKHLATAGGAGNQCALIMCEISDLDLIDQNFGQNCVENTILTASHRLADIKVDHGEIAYLDRGRLGIFVHAMTDTMAILGLAKDLTAKLGQPVDWYGENIIVHAHAGISLSSSDGSDAPALLRSAELALRSAQEQGTPGYGFFNPEIAQDARRRTAVQKAVADAVLAQSFRLDFQPVYNIRTGELNGFEALIRLHDAELGAISPVEFIPIAEQAGLINKIGAWCLNEACRVAARWPSHLMVAVNLSPSQFYSGSLIADVHHALDQNQFPSYRLEVEITEGTMLKDSELVMQQLRVLRDLGVAVALDDFGTGYSSLSYLWKFPFSKLKIDRSFVQALDETPSARGILRSIVKLGHGLGLTVTAEGIENTKQFAVLRDLGCDLAQGFLLDRPALVTDLAGIILRNFAKGLSRRHREIAAPDAGLPAAGSSLGA